MYNRIIPLSVRKGNKTIIFAKHSSNKYNQDFTCRMSNLKYKLGGNINRSLK